MFSPQDQRLLASLTPPPPQRDLSGLISEIDCLRTELGYARWSHIRHFADVARPQIAGEDDLERLLERLCVRWADGR